MLAFSFSVLKRRKKLQRYLKHALSLFKALTNCFIKPSLICSRGKMIFSRSTNGSLIMFASPTFIDPLVGHVLFTQCCCRALLSHKHIKYRILCVFSLLSKQKVDRFYINTN